MYVKIDTQKNYMKRRKPTEKKKKFVIEKKTKQKGRLVLAKFTIHQSSIAAKHTFAQTKIIHTTVNFLQIF